MKIRFKILFTFILTSTIIILLSGVYNIVNLNQLNDSQVAKAEEILTVEYDRLIRNEVETTMGILDTYYSLYKEGELTEEEAQELAKRTIKSLYYGEDGYFWIDNTNGILEAHPFISDQEGANRMDLTDSEGVRIVEALIDAAVNNKNNGYTATGWEKPEDVGTGKLTTQVIYSKHFPEWNWVISTGHFIDGIATQTDFIKKELNDNLTKSIFAVIMFVALAILVVGVVGTIISKKISTPINKLVKAFETDENGQVGMQNIEINSKDEIGTLGHTMNELATQVREFVAGVSKEAKNVAESANNAEGGMNELHDQIQNASATTEQLSAATEETAASTQEMTATATELLSAVESIATKAQSGSIVTSELSSKSKEVKEVLSTKISESNEIMSITEKQLNIALENSKSVSKINTLADAILQIANETNLLALNASIEAARAGDAGRGFVVVAGEIKKLSEDSKQTVAEIQDVIKIVIESVDELANSTMKFLEFVSRDTTSNYEFMLQTSDDYSTSSEEVNSLVGDFYKTAEELQESIRGILNVIESISIATNESASGTTHIAENTSVIAARSKEILEQANNSKKYSDNLLNLVSKFKI